MMQEHSSAMTLSQDPALYRNILVALDSSDHANRGIAEAATLAALSGGSITGTHVYAAQMHDRRFRQMEGGLPEQFREEDELERQREVHDDLITRGLSIITDSYLEQAAKPCAAAAVPLRRCALEGKNYRALANEVNSGRHDLLVMGALGLGRVAGDRLGTVCARVARRSGIDTLIIKDPQRPLSDGPIAVAVDGSARAYGGLRTALLLANAWGVPLNVLAAFDPYFHYVAFNRIAGVLSAEARKVFSFKDQEKMHEEIIDSGLAKIYEGHLAVASRIAAESGQEVETVLLDGKPYEAIGKYLAKLKPSLLFMGKVGIHADPELDIGGNAEALLRSVDCAVLLSQRQHQPRVDVVAEVTTSWTTEAEQRMESVPAFAQSMVRMAILRFSQERGHTVVTAGIVDEATAELCPAHARDAMAEIVAAHDNAALGKSPAVLEDMEWTGTANELLQSVQDASVRESIRRRAEKKARRDNMLAVDDEHISTFLSGQFATEDEVPTRQVTPGVCPFGHSAQTASAAEDDSLNWDSAATERLQRVPQGFMRALTQQRVEAFARQRGESRITVELLDEKYADWGAGSAQQSTRLHWDNVAWQRVQQIPDFVRGMVIREMENWAQQLGVKSVSTDVLERARSSWSDNGAFHSAAVLPPIVGDGARQA